MVEFVDLPERLNVERLLAESFLAHVEHHDSLGSTQDRAHELAREAAAKMPVLVVADRQTAGRGRGTNRWWTGEGSLAFSLLFDPELWGLARRASPERSLAVAVALIDMISPWLGDCPLGLHWPNDVFVSGRKVAGILIDVLPDGRHILGIGLNTNNSLEGAPEEVRRRATSLRELTGRKFSHTDVLLLLCERLEETFRQLAEMPELIGRRFNELCLQIGAPLTIEVAGRRTRGNCVGIGADGCLLLETADGWQKFYSGALCHDE